MQMIQINLQDELYNTLQKQGVNIETEISEYLSFLTDASYPQISTIEAKKRVKNAYEDYQKNGLDNFAEIDENYWENLDELLEKGQDS